MFGVVDRKACAQGMVGGAYPRRLVDADLVGDGQVQGEMKEGIHLSAVRREFLLDRSLRIFQQRMVLRMVFDEVGGGHLGTFERQALAVFAPGFAEKLTDLLAAWIEHGRFGLPSLGVCE